MAERDGEMILLVEDEDFVRSVTKEVLEMEGYLVLEARDAQEGLEIFGKHGSEIDLLLTDVVMPGMNGRDLAAKLVGRNPLLKTIFMSGYTDNAIVRKGMVDERVRYLQKPYTLDGLNELVREVLDCPTATPLEVLTQTSMTTAGRVPLS